MTVGRNDPCPCGSGLKYKKCCMLKESEEQQLDRYAEQMIRVKTDMFGALRTFAVVQMSDDDLKQAWSTYQNAAEPTRKHVAEAAPSTFEMLQDIGFDMWLFFDCPDEDGQRLASAYAQSGQVQGEDGVDLLRATAASALVPFDVAQVERDCWVTLTPLFGGEPIKLFDRYVARGVQEGQVIVTRLYEFDGRWQQFGTSTMLGPGLRDELKARLREAYDEKHGSQASPEGDDASERNWYEFFSNATLTTLRIVESVRRWASTQKEETSPTH